MNLSDINIKSPLFSGSQFLNYNQGYIYNKVYIYIYMWHTQWKQSLKPRKPMITFSKQHFNKCKWGKIRDFFARSIDLAFLKQLSLPDLKQTSSWTRRFWTFQRQMQSNVFDTVGTCISLWDTSSCHAIVYTLYVARLL